VPVITISGNAGYLSNSSKLGATRALLKPFRMAELVNSIDAALTA
jgi:DNA-binding response OmpR family regulator